MELEKFEVTVLRRVDEEICMMANIIYKLWSIGGLVAIGSLTDRRFVNKIELNATGGRAIGYTMRDEGLAYLALLDVMES